MPRYGEATLALIEDVYRQGADHVAALMRHSAREFEPGRHDLLNPLTDAGRALRARVRQRPAEGRARARLCQPG